MDGMLKVRGDLAALAALERGLAASDPIPVEVRARTMFG
jgi:hypothetical protein